MLRTVDVDPSLLKGEEGGEPKIIRVNRFNERAAKVFSDEVAAAVDTGQPMLPIVIDSFGGEVYALLSMVDILKTVKIPVVTIVQGKAMSCGAVLASCGSEGFRFIAPNATVMIHDVMAYEPMKKAMEIHASSTEISRLNHRLYKIMETNIGKPENYLWDMSHAAGRADVYLDAKKAVSIGFSNHIGIPRWHTTVKVEHTLIVAEDDKKKAPKKPKAQPAAKRAKR